MSELALHRDDTRHNRATALCLAAMSFRGDAFDIATLMALADEYLAYIEGDDATPIPRPDLTGDIEIGKLKQVWWRTWRKHRAWYDTPLMKANDLSGPALIMVARHFSNPQFAWTPANDREIWRW